MNMGFYFDQSRCHGCFTCSVACKDWHDIPAGPASLMRMFCIEEGRFPDPFVAYLTRTCYHCADPPCVAVCPAEAITQREEDGIVVVDREKCKEASRCGTISEEALPIPLSFGEREAPCKITCPAHLDVAGYVALIAKGKFKEALELIRQRMPLPSVCGRVCLSPCERECRRQEVDEPVAINALKRFATEYITDDVPSPVPRTKKDKVAIIGSGPAGLAAAYDLVRKGYGTTVFEALPVAGGMLAVGIPEYRLPKKVLERDINYIKGLGVEIRTNTALDEDDLAQQGYSATLIAVGAHQGQKLDIPGADLEGTLVGTSFLHDVNLGKEVRLGQKTLVIGGGNVAFDCARAARRLGVSEVHIACLETLQEMPADPLQIKEGEQEGVIINPCRTFTRILGQDGRVSGVECLNLRRMEFDEEGQLHADVIEGTEHILSADTVIFAVGQSPILSAIAKDGGMDVTKWGVITVDPETMETSRPGVFAAGDATGGPATVIDAIASGQKAAVYIDRYLQGDVLRDARREGTVKACDIKVNIPTDIEKQERQHTPVLPAAERVLNFTEVASGFSQEIAIAEAKRCLNCAGHLCKDVCPYDAPQFGAEENAKMQKCDLCLERWAENRKPICVEGCPMRALDAGPIEELMEKYGQAKDAEGFVYSSALKPSIVFKPKKRKSQGKWDTLKT